MTTSDVIEYIAVDVKTANNYQRSICALGVATVAGDNGFDAHSWLVKPPGNRYDAEQSAAHGLCAEHTEGAPTFVEVWPKVSPVIGKKVIISHNAEHATSCIGAAMRHHKQPEPTFRQRVGCTLRMAHLVWPERTTSYSLGALCADRGIPYDPHDAGACAEATAALVEALLKDWGQGDLLSLISASNRGHVGRAEAAQKRIWYNAPEPPTDKQFAFLTRLLEERGVAAKRVIRLLTTRGQVSQLIDTILEGKDSYEITDVARYRTWLERKVVSIVEGPPPAPQAPKRSPISESAQAQRRDAERERREAERSEKERRLQAKRATPPSLDDLLAIHLPGPRETARDPHRKAEREFSDTVIARVENAAQAAAFLDYRYDTQSNDPARWERQFQQILQTYATPEGVDLPAVGKLCPIPDGHNQPEPFVDKIERLRGVRVDPPQETRDWSHHDIGNRAIPEQRRGFWGRLFGR